MIRVLQVVGHMSMGGIQAFIMNVYRHIDRSQVQFDFLLNREYDQPYYTEIKELGGHIYYVAPRKEGLLKSKRGLEQFFDNHSEYDIVHMHASSLSYLTPLIIAKKHGINKRIIHSHNSNIRGGLIHKFLHWWHKKKIHEVATDYLACGEMALRWMYGGSKVEDKAIVIYNGIDIKSFSTKDDSLRLKMRQQMGITTDELVIGHVARFNPVKNHHFIIEIFKELLLIHPNSRLVLIGDGSMKHIIEEQVTKRGIDNHVLFLGIRNDINFLLQAMDVFVLPSLYEGVPIVAIEAQAAGLPVLMSDTISSEVVIKNNVEQMSIQLSAKEWAQKIISMSNKMQSDNQVLYDSGFDIYDVVNCLCNLYVEN